MAGYWKLNASLSVQMILKNKLPKVISQVGGNIHK